MVHFFFFQVLGTLFIYVLFMVEEFRKEPVENMDDVIYYVNGTYRLLEFLVALCVVAYGVSETIFGEWTVMGSMIIFIHSYYNVWLRAQLGWKSFLLRRDAVNKIKSLPTATEDQLEQHNDICAICYQVCNVSKQRLFRVYLLSFFWHQVGCPDKIIKELSQENDSVHICAKVALVEAFPALPPFA